MRLAGSDAATGNDIEISGVLHDIQYQGAATRYELQLDNGDSFSITQSNNQWNQGDAQIQPGQTVTARWPREAMVPLDEGK